MAKKFNNPPSAFTLMDSMRSIGYTFNSAIADIVDNSISAEAKNLDICISSDPSNVFLTFIDDGNGMDEEELRLAMKYGSKSKDQARKEIDLGRFGLGLKSASLSQCKKVTVASKKNGIIKAALWDMSYVEAENEWALLELEDREIEELPNIDTLKELEQGTLVVWQDFDTLRFSNQGEEYEPLKECIFEAADYLGLIFHRYLELGEFDISINGTSVDVIDPFLERNKKTEVGKEFDITVPDETGEARHISVTPYLLPYLKDLSTDDKHKLGGVGNISTKQGFYVYRNKRLIIFGTWFKMSHKNELSKYARIRVDIPTTLDSVWKIDVKKQTAELPPVIKRQLQSCVDNISYSSKRKNEHRNVLNEGDKKTIWQKSITVDKKAIYSINRDAPYILSILNSFEQSEIAKINHLLDAVERSIPYHDMYVDEANDNIDETFSDEAKASMVSAVVETIENIVAVTKKTKQEAFDSVMCMEPFSKNEWIRPLVIKELEGQLNG